MLFITGPLYSGKRTFAKPFGGRQIYEVQTFAANAESDVKRSGLGLPFTVVFSLLKAISSATAISSHFSGCHPSVAEA